MSLRLEMLQVARLSPKLLGDSRDLVRDFLRSQQNKDGGFKDRGGKSDLYYTVFGIDSLVALQETIPFDLIDPYLRSFGDGESLDFVHLACLARCWSALPQERMPKHVRTSILQKIEQYRTVDGGYHHRLGCDGGTVYDCFLAYGAYQDLKMEITNPEGLIQCLACLKTNDDVWSNERNVQIGSTNATAAAATLLRHLNMNISPSIGDWFMTCYHPQGGFRAMPQSPIPDLLSTATVLHALAGLQYDFSSVRESCLDFVDSLWTNKGAFHGSWADDHLDCEYTYYALLALGHLSL